MSMRRCPFCSIFPSKIEQIKVEVPIFEMEKSISGGTILADVASGKFQSNNSHDESSFKEEEKVTEYEGSIGNFENELDTHLLHSPLQSIMMADSPSWLTESSLFKKPVLERGDILHHYITGENEYNLLTEQYTGEPLIETKLEGQTSSLVLVSGFGSINSDDVVEIKNSQSKKKVPDAFRGFFDKCLGKLFGKSLEKGERPQEEQAKTNKMEEPESSDISVDPKLSLDVQSNVLTDFSSLSFGSRVDLLNDYDSFISDDRWLFNVVSAQKFKYLCTNCSEHFWEESGKIPSL